VTDAKFQGNSKFQPKNSKEIPTIKKRNSKTVTWICLGVFGLELGIKLELPWNFGVGISLEFLGWNLGFPWNFWVWNLALVIRSHPADGTYSVRQFAKSVPFVIN
jgi:hypothetical protein